MVARRPDQRDSASLEVNQQQSGGRGSEFLGGMALGIVECSGVVSYDTIVFFPRLFAHLWWRFTRACCGMCMSIQLLMWALT